MKNSQIVIIFILISLQILYFYLCWHSEIPMHLPILFFIFILIKVIVDLLNNKVKLSLNWRIFYYAMYTCLIYSIYMNLINIQAF